MDLTEARKAEHRKYKRAYAQQPNYKMGSKRMNDAVNDLRAIPARGSYLDVSCGRGEMLDHARKLGFKIVTGTEIVPELLRPNVFFSEVHQIRLVNNFAEVVTMFDVIEHLIPGDVPERVVDFLEAVQVEQQQGQLRPGASAGPGAPSWAYNYETGEFFVNSQDLSGDGVTTYDKF